MTKGEKKAPRRLKSGNMLCPHFRSWVDTNKGEITSACVDEDKRTIRTCDWTQKSGCFKYPKGGQQ